MFHRYGVVNLGVFKNPSWFIIDRTLNWEGSRRTIGVPVKSKKEIKKIARAKNKKGK